MSIKPVPLTDLQKGERMLRRMVQRLPQCEERVRIEATGRFRCVYEAGHTDNHFFLLDPEEPWQNHR